MTKSMFSAPDLVFKLSLPQVNVNHEGAAVSSNVYQDVQI